MEIDLLSVGLVQRQLSWDGYGHATRHSGASSQRIGRELETCNMGRNVQREPESSEGSSVSLIRKGPFPVSSDVPQGHEMLW